MVAEKLAVRRLLIIIIAAVVVVLASPFALTPFGRFGTDWERLSEVGQAYGGISAILSAIAVIGVVVSLAIQSRSAAMDREQAIRTMHFDLLALALSDPNLLTTFNLEPPFDTDDHRRSIAYINLWISFWETLVEVGYRDPSHVAVNADAIMSSEAGAIYWDRYGSERIATARGRKRLLLEALGERHSSRSARPRAAPSRALIGAKAPAAKRYGNALVAGGVGGFLLAAAVRRFLNLTGGRRDVGFNGDVDHT